MPEFNKQQLLTRLKEIYEIHILGLASTTFLLRDKSLELLKQHNMMYYGHVHFLKNLAEELKDVRTRTIKTEKLISSTKFFFLTQPINTINEYFDINNHPRPFQSNWYLFGNTIRNYLTHGNLDYEKNFRQHNVTFPISWKGNTITENEVKTSQIDMSKFSHSYPLDLFEEIKLFAENLNE